MVRIYFINVFIVISTVCALAQTVEMKVSQEGGLDTGRFCDFEKKENNLLITNWEEAPILIEESKTYLNLICEQILKSGYNYSYMHIVISIDKNGIPFDLCLIENKEFVEEKYKNKIYSLSKNLRFTPAKSRGENVESNYLLTAKRNEKTGKWYFSELL